jgi:UDP-N-acetylmuramoyl-tripeptide--D-alanyl-D-alanine ligase
MIELALREVAFAVGGEVDGDGDLRVDAVGTDSRRLPTGRTLFVALPGEAADGHDFAAEAVEAGAVAVLAERHLDVGVPVVVVDDAWSALQRLGAAVRAFVRPTTVAVTGSVGKTTAKDLTRAAVAAGRRVHAAAGSYNNELGVPLTLLGLREDTEVLVAEVGARHVGDIAKLAPSLAPDIAMVTAVAGVHLEVFGTIEAVAQGKRELVEALGPHGVAVLNVADPRVAAMAEVAPRTIRVAMDDPDADLWARDVVLDRYARARTTAVTPWGETELRLPVAGRHHVTNALMALAVAGHLGVDLDAAAAGIAEARVAPGRGEVFVQDGVTYINDAYNANPTSVAAALETLVAIERTGRTVAALGVMAEIGPTAEEEHAAIGRRCVELGVDEVVVVGPDAVGIAEGVADALAATSTSATHVVRVDDAGAAATHLTDIVADGDVVLVKGSKAAGLISVPATVAAGRTAP